MCIKEAKRLGPIKRDLINKFKKAEIEEVKSRYLEKQQTEVDEESEVPKKKKISVAKARDLSILREKLQEEFITQRKRDVEDTEQREKKYEPITRALKAI